VSAPHAADLGLGRALVLGAVQGPTELLPISSSAHIALVPWICGWRWSEADPEARKSFEVALHAGTAAALLVGQRGVIVSELAAFDSRRAAVVAFSFLPPAVVGYGLERQIEGRLGGPRSIAVGLALGAVAMLLADRSPQDRGRVSQRRDAHGRPPAPLHPRAREPALAHGGAAGDRRRERAEGRPVEAPGARARASPRDGGRGRRLVRLDPRLAATHQAGRARPRPVAVRGLPPCVGDRGRLEAEGLETVSAVGASNVSSHMGTLRHTPRVTVIIATMAR
jgi:hypothetical protein